MILLLLLHSRIFSISFTKTKTFEFKDLKIQYKYRLLIYPKQNSIF